MKLVFLDAETLGDDLNLKRFEEWGQTTFWQNTTPEQTIEHIADADVVINNKVVLNEAVFAACPNLKLICLTATGYNNVELVAAEKRGIAVCNVIGYSTSSVAQHTVAILLALMEGVESLDRYAKNEWIRSRTFTHLGKTFHEIAGRTWGIIGLGNIGRSVANIAEAFGANVCYFSTTGETRSDRWPRMSLDELLSRCEIVTIHSPLNEATKGLIGKTQLRTMKKEAFLLNLGRGGIVDELALAEALDDGWIAGAGLDVLTREPPLPDHPLLHLQYPERLLMTPHVAWASLESRMRCLDEVWQNMASWQGGGRRNRVV